MLPKTSTVHFSVGNILGIYPEAAQQREGCEAAALCPLCLAWQVLNVLSMKL